MGWRAPHRTEASAPPCAAAATRTAAPRRTAPGARPRARARARGRRTRTPHAASAGRPWQRRATQAALPRPARARRRRRCRRRRRRSARAPRERGARGGAHQRGGARAETRGRAGRRRLLAGWWGCSRRRRWECQCDHATQQRRSGAAAAEARAGGAERGAHCACATAPGRPRVRPPIRTLHRHRHWPSRPPAAARPLLRCCGKEARTPAARAVRRRAGAHRLRSDVAAQPRCSSAACTSDATLRRADIVLSGRCAVQPPACACWSAVLLRDESSDESWRSFVCASLMPCRTQTVERRATPEGQPHIERDNRA